MNLKQGGGGQPPSPFKPLDRQILVMLKVLFIGDPSFPLQASDDFQWDRVRADGDWEAKILSGAPALVVLEVSKGVEAREVIEALRSFDPASPLPFIVLLPSLKPHPDRILDEAQDFMLKPYDPLELNLRVKRALKRLYCMDSAGQIKVGDLVIDLKGRRVTVRGEPIPLTFKEYELLLFLASNPGKVFSRETLLNRIWGYDYFGGDRTVDVHVRRLRVKVERHGERYIETVRGIGYRFRPLF